MKKVRPYQEMNAMSLARLQERGQFTVPAKLRDAVGLKPGDTLLLRALGPGRFEAVALPPHALSTFFEARGEGQPSLDQLRTEMGREMAVERRPVDPEAARREAATARLG
jgi:bifunctional DNA-binding transcriptional regulator/antitoxin component of YhaV-PrlF toxin-antitoxin module